MVALHRSGTNRSSATSPSTGGSHGHVDNSHNTAGSDHVSFVGPRGSVHMTQHKIDELAQVLQFSVDLEDRKCKKTGKKYQQVFVGAEAVDILLVMAKCASRQEALELGRLLQTNKNLFDCVNSLKVSRLEDDKRLFYSFVTNATAATRGKHDHLLVNLDEKMRILQRGVRVKDRSYRLTTYKQCFVGKEAVDLMMRHKMASSRAECVELVRILQRRYNLFVPMMGGEFEDE